MWSPWLQGTHRAPHQQTAGVLRACDNTLGLHYYTVWSVYNWCTMKSEQTRARIRVAAAKVIERDGAGQLTLEKVAAEADLSKGGLLYHYPSKDALLQGLLDHLLENRAGLIEGSGSADSVSEATLLNSLIDADFDLPKDERIMAQGLIAASAENPELITPAQQYVEAVFAQLGKAKTTATSARTIFLASQGLQFLELLGLLSLSTAERNEIRRHLKALTEELAPC